MITDAWTNPEKTPRQDYEQKQARRRGLVFGAWVDQTLRNAMTDHAPDTIAPDLLAKLDAICGEIFERWDKDQRSGKLLTALSGRLPGYRADVDAIRTALRANRAAPDTSTDIVTALRRCQRIYGIFEVRELARHAADEIERLHAIRAGTALCQWCGASVIERTPKSREATDAIKQAFRLFGEARQHLTIWEFRDVIAETDLGGQGFVASIGEAIVKGAAAHANEQVRRAPHNLK